MSSKKKGSPKVPKKKGASTTVNLRGDRLEQVKAVRDKLSKKAGVEVTVASAVNGLIDEGLKTMKVR
jgi:hypothetical protein